MAYVPHGGWAERVVADAANVFPIPAAMPFEVGAVLPVVYGTAIHALVDRGGLDPGRDPGGAGRRRRRRSGGGAGGQPPRRPGGRRRRLRRQGAGGHRCPARTPWCAMTGTTCAKRLRAAAPDGVDVVFDPVGGDATEPAFRSLSWGGRLLVVGFAAGAIPAIAAEPAAVQGRVPRRRVLGSIRPTGAGGQPRALRHAHRVVGGRDESPRRSPAVSGFDDGAEVLAGLAAGVSSASWWYVPDRVAQVPASRMGRPTYPADPVAAVRSQVAQGNRARSTVGGGCDAHRLRRFRDGRRRPAAPRLRRADLRLHAPPEHPGARSPTPGE